MSISYIQLKQNITDLRNLLIGRHLSKITYFCSDSFCCDLSKGGNLIIGLKAKDPFITATQLDNSYPSLPNNFVLALKKEISNGLITNISIPVKDRIVEIELQVLNSVFKEENKILVLELIPNKTNLIVLSQDRKIILCYKKFSDSRLSIKNSYYEYPESKEFDENKICSEKVDYQEKIQALLEIRKNEKFKEVINFINRRLKISKNKIENIKLDIEKAQSHINDNELGDLIFVHINEINKNENNIELEGRKIELNKKLSLAENAQSFYKRSKKAKATIHQAETNLLKANKEFSDFSNLKNLILNSDEEQCAKLFEEFSILDLLNKKKNNEDLQVFSSANKPFEFEVYGTRIWFGKNAKQNDYLSFVADTSKKHIWMHIIGNSGAHLIIRNENPSKEIIELCGQILCYASKQPDGQIMYTEKKNIRKGNVAGEVKVKQYDTMRINNVTDKAKTLFESATKI